MSGLDDAIAHLSHGGASFAVALAVAVLLGLRHATDPDHLTAVASLVVGDEREGARRAGRLGLAWGIGHATTLLLFGLPVVLYGRSLSDPVRRAAEFGVGLMIVALAVRLLVRWRRGVFHAHAHTHGAIRHAHPHVHAAVTRAGGRTAVHEHLDAHDHAHAPALGRSPQAAFAIGLVHGMAGSGAAAVLLLSAVVDRVHGAIALTIFAAATAASMAMVSGGFGYALARGTGLCRITAFAPGFGIVSLAFGVVYAVGAL
jgi:ABC-type nickel/cobalt efflux system permease component RcnA